MFLQEADVTYDFVHVCKIFGYIDGLWKKSPLYLHPHKDYHNHYQPSLFYMMLNISYNI